MTNKLQLSWCTGNGEKSVGGCLKHPSKNLIIEKFSIIKKEKGTLTLDFLNEDHLKDGPIQFQIATDGVNFVLMLGEIINGEYSVREYKNTNIKGNSINILGEDWHRSVVCKDSNEVKNILLEFIDTGNSKLLT